VGDYLHCGFLGLRHIHASRWEDVTGFLRVSAPMFLPVRKVFFSKERFVKLSAEPHSTAFREHHAGKSIRFFHSVNRFFLFIFWRCPAIIVPAINKRILTSVQA
jgi:hypothetical protein